MNQLGVYFTLSRGSFANLVLIILEGAVAGMHLLCRCQCTGLIDYVRLTCIKHLY